jgi:hypothetical protein
MITASAGVKVHIALGVTDMRKGIDGLATLVQEILLHDPFSGHLFAFRGGKANLIKILYWDGTGLCLFTKRLEHGAFEWPAAHLKKFKGILQVDGYAGFEPLTAHGTIELAACWAHTRRKFYDVHQATASPIAEEALRRIGALYTIEQSIRGQSAQERQRVRDVRSRRLTDAMRPWLERQLQRVPGRSGLAEAIRYALARWEELCRFLDDGRVELDTNTVERAIRPITLGRKNHLFAGSDGGADRWAVIATLITTAKLNDVEPYAYLKDVIERLAGGHPMARLDDLLPWNWKAAAASA